MDRRRLAFVFSLVFAFTPALVRAEPTTRPSTPTTRPVQPARFEDFLRFVDNGATGSKLEAADVLYENKDGVKVHLVSAVHIGEKAYFNDIAKDFESRDAVLYEMVKPKDAPVPGQGVQSNSGVSQLQRFMKDTLDLSFQLDEIDYSKSNFIHADLDAETFQQMQDERGESFTTLMLKHMMNSMSNPQNADALNGEDAEKQLEDLVKLFTRPDGSRQMKLLLARNMAKFENDAMGLSGSDGTVIVTERNKAAIRTLQKAIQDGKKDIAIFYGAAHMPDMAERLVKMGFMPVETNWRTAWDLTIRADQPSAAEKMLMELIKGLNELDR
jgi:hypothetical protein